MVLAKLIELPLASDGDHPVTTALEMLRSVYAGRGRELPPAAHIDLGSRWCELIGAEDRVKALGAFQWATLFKLRVALRNGSVHLAHSFAFRGHAAPLIPKDVWLAQRNHHYGHLKLTQSPKEYIARVKEQLQERLKQLAKAVVAGELRVDKEGIHLESKPADPEDLRVSELRRALYAGRSLGPIAEMILRVWGRCPAAARMNARFSDLLPEIR